MKRGRIPGTLCRFKCCACGEVEMATGGSNRFRCKSCVIAGRFAQPNPRTEWLGAARAQALVQIEISRGAIPHPKSLRCVDCDAPAVEYEHRDYNRPLHIEPICRSCNLKRGPAIPRAGAVELLLSLGRSPYATRNALEKLGRLLGVPDVAADIPRKKLTVVDWRRVWPALAERMPAPEPKAIAA